MWKLLILFLSCGLLLHSEPLTPIKKKTPVVVLGGGIAGMTAALQLSQAGMMPLVIVGPSPGGVITVSHEVENWPGDILIRGADLADRFEQQLKNREVELLSAVATDVDFSHRPFLIKAKNPLVPTESYEIEAPCCIIALGATPKLLQVPGESALLYKKIFTCAPCDGFRFKDQTVAVIGGGEAALVEAHYLATLAKQVYVIVRGDQFKTIQPSLKEKLFSKSNVKILYQTTVQQFEETSAGIKLYLNPQETLLVQAAFLAIGSHPNTQILKQSLKLDPQGYVILERGQMTSIPGVFAAGDVSDRVYKQASTAAGDATKAALDAISFLSNAPPLPVAASTSPPSEPTEILSLANLRSILQTAHKPAILYFYSPSCSPCRSFRPLYQKWAQDFGSVASFLKINGETSSACFKAYNVQAIPTILVLDPDGHIAYRATGISHMSEVLVYLEKLKN